MESDSSWSARPSHSRQEAGKGTLKFGTEVITSKDGSVAALLGASPGASVVVDVMLEDIKRCFPQKIKEWDEGRQRYRCKCCCSKTFTDTANTVLYRTRKGNDWTTE